MENFNDRYHVSFHLCSVQNVVVSSGIWRPRLISFSRLVICRAFLMMLLRFKQVYMQITGGDIRHHDLLCELK